MLFIHRVILHRRYFEFSSRAFLTTQSKRLTALFVGTLILCSIAPAQTASTGAIAGTISDPSGAVIQGAVVRMVNEVTGEVRTVNSTSSGNYEAELLTPGSYRVEISKAGFKQSADQNVKVIVTETSKLSVQLQPGSEEQTVTVSGQTDILQTESNALGRVSDQRVVEGLPLVTRNYTQLIGLSPGVTTSVTNAGNLGRGNGGISTVLGASATLVHGERPYDNNFLINGLSATDYQSSDTESGGVAIPNPDSIQEFKVQTGQYDASFGPGGGANVDLITKVGGNQFHGSLFEFVRNDVFNANDFFFNRTGQKKPVMKQNQFGVAAGGPVKRDKVLVFGSYQGTRQKNGYSNVALAKCRDAAYSPPFTNDRSAAALGSLFAGQRGVLQDELGGVGPAIQPDGSNINPVALNLLQAKLPNGQYVIPTPQTLDASQPFASQGFSAFSEPCSFNEDQYMGNGDYLQSARSKVSARYFSANGNTDATLPSEGTGSVPGFPRLQNDQFVNASLTHSFVFGPNLFNEASVGYHRIYVASHDVSSFSYSDLGVLAAPTVNDAPYIVVNGSYALGGGIPEEEVNNVFTGSDSVSYIHGKHAFRFGGTLTRVQLDIDWHFYGESLFLSWPDLLLGLDGAHNGTGLFSNVFASIDYVGQPNRAFRGWEGSLYAQDDYKITPRLTLNLGVRYDRLGAYTDAQGKNANFDVSLADPNPPSGGSLAGYVVSKDFRGTLPPGVKKSNSGLPINGDGQNNFGPRFGYAFRLLPNSERVVFRGGYGIYYSRLTGQLFFGEVTTLPYVDFRISEGTPNAAATFQSPFPQPIPPSDAFPIFPAYSPTTSLSVNGFDPKLKPGITQQFSQNVQTQIARNMLLEVGYVGARGTSLLNSRSVNQANLASPANAIRGLTTNTVANIPQRVPIEGWTPTGIAYGESKGYMWYNGLETSLTKRFSNGLQFLGSYTFSKTLDSDAANVAISSGNNGTIGNQDVSRDRYGRSAFDRRHRFIFSYVYELPRPGAHGAFVSAALGGWSVAGDTTIQSGQALTVTDTNANNVYGVTTDRAQIVSGCTQPINPGSVKNKLNNYFNAACFATPPVIGDDGIGTSFGNSPVGVGNGPDQDNTDIAIIKRTGISHLGEGANLEFRAEFFNAFNTPQFSNPDGAYSDTSFGQITSTAVNPRFIQLALKLNF
jgi:Carboxypeptidase regulatory-like domain/TonB dependent receptor